MEEENRGRRVEELCGRRNIEREKELDCLIVFFKGNILIIKYIKDNGL